MLTKLDKGFTILPHLSLSPPQFDTRSVSNGTRW